MAKAYISGVGAVELQEKVVDVTENGTVEIIPDDGKLLRNVTVNVDTPIPKAEQEKSLTVTKDGTYRVLPDEGMVLSAVEVEVDTPNQKPEQEKTVDITADGTYEVTPDTGLVLRKVTVNVDTPDKKPEQEKTLNVTKDGTYTVTPDSGYVLKKVSVLVDTPDQKPEQNKSINVTENGIYSLTPDTGFVLNGATVNVAIPLKAEQEKTVDITNSGSFEILPDEGKLLSKVTVNASSGEDNIYSEGLEMEWDMAGYYIVNGRGDCTDKVIRIPDAYSDGTHGRARVAMFKNSALSSDELLTAVHIPTTMNTVSNGALYGCPNLKKIYMPSIKMLENYRFRGSSSLEYVEFGWDIGSLGQNVFENCKSGAVFDFSKCYAVPTLDLGGWGYEFGSNPVIKVPNHLLSRWKIATNWTQYASYIVAAE